MPESPKIFTRHAPIEAKRDDPPLAKKLSSNPIESPRMNRGCDSRAPHDSDNSMEGAKLVSETWGGYHSPEEFDAAVEAGHPHETMPPRSISGFHQKE